MGMAEYISRQKVGIQSVPNQAAEPRFVASFRMWCTWEHAYYLKYQNKGPTPAVTNVVNQINWDDASSRFDKSEANQLFYLFI